MIKIPSFKIEEYYWNKGFKHIAGVDEVGRGAFAGPIVAASVILPKNFKLDGIRDSKQLTAKKRNEFSEIILQNSISYFIAEIDLNYINEFGIGKANHKAITESIINLPIKSEFSLIDGFAIDELPKNEYVSLIGGDSISISIAAASIIAKVYRDNLMDKLHLRYPQYNFLENKGYGTKFHRDAIKTYGLSKIHRTSFKLEKFT